jgi:hypothetical protein
MMGAGMGAADKRIQRRDAVNKAILLEEIQRPVNRRRRGVMAIPGKHGQNIVSTQGAMGLPDQLKHPFTGGGQAGIPALADAAGVCQCIGNAGIVIVLAVGKCAGGHWG